MPDRIRILIVDDSRRARQSLRALLAVYGELTEVHEAESGSEALQSIDEAFPDVVFMDIMMPEMDGIQATRLVKLRSPEIKLIALSISSDYRSEALAAGADAFVCKGDPPEELLQALARLTG